MRRWIAFGSYREFHSIIGDFPAGITDDARFLALVIQYRIRIVDVYEDAARLAGSKWMAEQPAVAPQREVPHLARGFASFLYGVQLVVSPKRAIQNREVALLHAARPLVAYSWKIWGVEEF